MDTNLKNFEAIWCNNSGNIYNELYLDTNLNKNILLNWTSGAGKGTLLRGLILSLSPRLDYSIDGTSYNELSSKVLLSNKLSDIENHCTINEYKNQAFEVISNQFNLNELKLKKRSFVGLVYTNDNDEYFVILTMPDITQEARKLQRYFLKFDDKESFNLFRKDFIHNINISQKNTENSLEDLIFSMNIKSSKQTSRNHLVSSLFIDKKSIFYSGLDFSDYDKKIILSIGLGSYDSISLTSTEILSEKLSKKAIKEIKDDEIKNSLLLLIQDINNIQKSRENDVDVLESITTKLTNQNFNFDKNEISLFLKTISEYNKFINNKINSIDFKENELNESLIIVKDDLRELSNSFAVKNSSLSIQNEELNSINKIIELFRTLGLDNDVNYEEIVKIINQKKEILKQKDDKLLDLNKIVNNSKELKEEKESIIRVTNRKIDNISLKLKREDQLLITEDKKLISFKEQKEILSLTKNVNFKNTLYIYEYFGDKLDLDKNIEISSLNIEDINNINNLIKSLERFIPNVYSEIEDNWNDHLELLSKETEESIKKNIIDIKSLILDLEIELKEEESRVNKEKLNLKDLTKSFENLDTCKDEIILLEKGKIEIDNNLEQYNRCLKFLGSIDPENLNDKLRLIEDNIKELRKDIIELELNIISKEEVEKTSLKELKDIELERKDLKIFKMDNTLFNVFNDMEDEDEDVEIINYKESFNYLINKQLEFIKDKKNIEVFYENIVRDLTLNGQETWKDFIKVLKAIQNDWKDINVSYLKLIILKLEKDIDKKLSNHKDDETNNISSFSHNFRYIPNLKNSLFGNFKREINMINTKLDKMKSISGYRFQIIFKNNNISTDELSRLDSILSCIPNFANKDIYFEDLDISDWKELLDIKLVKNEVLEDLKEVFLLLIKEIDSNDSIKKYIKNNIESFLKFESIGENNEKSDASSGNFNSIVSYGRRAMINSIKDLYTNTNIINIPIFFDEISKSAKEDIVKLFESSVISESVGFYLQQGDVNEEIRSRCNNILSIPILKTNYEALGYSENRKIFSVSNIKED